MKFKEHIKQKLHSMTTDKNWKHRTCNIKSILNYMYNQATMIFEMGNDKMKTD